MLYFEDFHTGDVYELGTVTVDENEIVEFAHKYDPQPFHTDPEQAARSSFEGLVASGWLTAVKFMRCYVDGLLNDSACEGSPGIDELRYHRPVRPGDVLSARLTVIGATPLLGRKDIGMVRPRCELLASDGVPAFSMILNSLFRRRPADSAAD